MTASIADIVTRYVNDPATPPPESLITALVQREEAMAGVLRTAGMQFGLFPQIVAEVLAEVEMGEPISPEQRQMIRAQFNALMSQIAAAQRGEGPMPQP
jgi:hypothetical protein